jgi:DNA replication protein DnaC
VTDPISPDLKTAMRRLRLGMLLDTLPERLALAREQKMAHQDFLLLLLSDECQRRDSAASTTRAQRALLDPEMQIERWDPTAKVTYDQELLNELVLMRFVEAHRHATVVGPVGVGKTFIADALGHIACRHKYSVLAVRTDKLLKTLKHARLDHSHETELRKLLAVDVLIIDDFCLDAMDATESRDVHEILTSTRFQASGRVVWLTTCHDEACILVGSVGGKSNTSALRPYYQCRLRGSELWTAGVDHRITKWDVGQLGIVRNQTFMMPDSVRLLKLARNGWFAALDPNLLRQIR